MRLAEAIALRLPCSLQQALKIACGMVDPQIGAPAWDLEAAYREMLTPGMQG